LNLSAKIGAVLRIGGILMASCFMAAIIMKLAGLSLAFKFTLAGIIIAAATPVAGVIAAMISLFINKETKYAIFAVILLVFMILGCVWRLTS
jgi:uncharacterized membrane protein